MFETKSQFGEDINMHLPNTFRSAFPTNFCCCPAASRERQQKQGEGRCSKPANSGLEFATVEDDLARFGRLLDQPDMEVNL
jgi:hypothetical protein